MLPTIAPHLGTPSSASSPFPYPYRVIGMVMIAFVGLATFDKSWDRCHLDPPERRLGKPEAPVEQRHTGSLLLLIRFLRSCAWCGCSALGSRALGDDLQDSQPHKGFSPHSSRGLSKSSVMPLSGAEGGEPTATLALCMGVCGLFNHLPHQSDVSTLRSLRKKRKKRRK
jgi:hypothetical protein